MYQEDRSAIKQEWLTTESFQCYNGVKQGCILSPTLFHLYLNDLPDILNQSESVDPILVDGSPLNCLLYADDLVLFSKNPNDLQTLLNQLNLYADSIGLTVNIEKTKVLIFNKAGRRLSNYVFLYKDHIIENARLYKYLGPTLDVFGSFSFAQQELKKSALKALFKLKKIWDHFLTTTPHLH